MITNEFIEVDTEKMSGQPVFTGTRVPIKHLFDYLEASDSLEEFLNDFPTVKREQALGVLELMRERLFTELPRLKKPNLPKTGKELVIPPEKRLFVRGVSA